MSISWIVCLLACTIVRDSLAHKSAGHIKFSGALTDLNHRVANGLPWETTTAQNISNLTKNPSEDPARVVIFNATQCRSRFPLLYSEVASYQTVVDQIAATTLNGRFKGATFGNLSEFVDNFSNRLSGTRELEDAIDYVANQMKNIGYKNVHTEKVRNVPAWKRVVEEAQILTPKRKDLSILGLGSTANTLPPGLVKEAVVFNSYTDLIANQSKVRGKIAVCNFGGPSSSPLDTIDNGYADAVTSGALAMLYRSAASFSLYSPHARRANLYYIEGVKKVPIAYLTVEDADLLSRIYARGEKITIYLNINDINGTKSSRNLIGDIVGREKPEEVIVVAGHTDTWDVGQGAQDDGFAIYLALLGTNVLKSLNFIPRRTIRTALWTAEEYGYLGSAAYIKSHRSEMDKVKVALEADYGCLASTGLIFNGKKELGCVLSQVLQMLGTSVNYGLVVQANIYRSDLDNFEEAGIPVVGLNGDDGRYFYFHHTHADTMTAFNTSILDKCLATWTATSYILADLKYSIPRGFDKY